MDGTLTLPIHNFEDIRKSIGIAPGQPILEAIDKMPEDQAKAAIQMLHQLEMDLAYQAQPQPGVDSLLDQLIHKGKTLGILTRNGDKITHATLEAAGLSRFFEKRTIISRDSCLPKPNPDGVIHLLDLWQAEKDETVIVGDYLYDIEAGFKAGINTVHYDHQGVFAWPEFAHHKITRLDQLKAMF